MMTFRVIVRVATVPLLVLLALVNIVHPFVHSLEGGSLDLVLNYINTVGAQVYTSINNARS